MAGTLVGLALVACGGSAQDVGEPKANFPVDVPTATFPSSQHLSQHTHLVITVRNLGNKPIPNLAVTICNVTCAYSPNNPDVGTSVQAFSEKLHMARLANPSRPVWIVDQPPGPCAFGCAPNRLGGGGGAGGYVTAYANTWALGHPLTPGATATFDWGVTAVKPGKHVVAWQVAAGLNGNAKAVLPDGSRPQGTLRVTISGAPQQSYVDNSGKIVVTH